MFEDMTYEKLLADVLADAPEGVDTRKGSIFYDAISGILIKIAKLYTDLDLVVDITRMSSMTGEALDIKAAEYGIERKAATPARYNVTFTGTVPSEGERFFTNGVYFVLKSANSVMFLEAERAGIGGNNIYNGTNAVPVNNIPGLTSATFGTIYENGTNAETDASLRERISEKIAKPAENGNKQHYKVWCESVDGVGRARIFPLWNGVNTVKAVLIDGLGEPCSATKVAEVQEYVDPAKNEGTATVNGVTYVVGDGLGEGVANLGAHFTAAPAVRKNIAVTFTGELASGYTTTTAAAEATTAITKYFRELVMGTENDSNLIVRISAIGAILSGLDGVVDYSDLQLNGDDSNIELDDDEVPILTSVVVST